MSLPIIDIPEYRDHLNKHLNQIWSSYSYFIESFCEDDSELEKLYDDIYGLTRSSNDSKMIPNEFLELIYERHEDPNKLYGLVHSLFEYWVIERTFYNSLRKLEDIVSKDVGQKVSFWTTRNVSDDTIEYPIEMLKRIFKVNVKELV